MLLVPIVGDQQHATLLGEPPDILIAGVIGYGHVAQPHKEDSYISVPSRLPQTRLEVSRVACNIMVEEDGRVHALAVRPGACGRVPGA